MLSIATFCLFLSIYNVSSGKKHLSLRERLFNGINDNNGRRLIEISFNDKICVDWPEGVALTAYNGDYTYNGMRTSRDPYTGIIDGKPSYIRTTCRDVNDCENDVTLIFGDDKVWSFYAENLWKIPCEFAGAEAPNDCTLWWGTSADDQPTITACGNIRTEDNGISQEETDKQNACIALQNEEKRYYLTPRDKDELLRQFNVQRALYHQSPFEWSEALEAVAQATVDEISIDCVGRHALTGDEAKRICIDNGGNPDDCVAAGTQGLSEGPNVNVLLWDGYGHNGHCYVDGVNWSGVVWDLMSDEHRGPMTGEGNTVNSVGCAFHSCFNSYSNGQWGYIACNYM